MKEAGKLKFIDSLRGLAILMVVMIHVSQVGDAEYPLFFQNIFNFGRYGVQLFFMCSAFTIFLSFERRSKIDKYPILFFFTRRFFRIAPLFYIAILYYLFQDGFGPRFWLGDQNTVTIYNIISSFLFVNSFNPYWINSIVPGGWSIAIEMIFYLMVPILAKYLTSHKKVILTILFSVICSYFFNNFFMHHQLISDNFLWREYTYFNIINQFYFFILGISLFFFYKDSKDWIKSISKFGILYSILILISIATDFKIFLDEKVLCGLLFSILFLYVYIYQPKILVNNFFISIGKNSYSIYLCHFAVIYIFNKLHILNIIDMALTNYFLLYILILLSSYLIAELTKKNIEARFINWGEVLIKKITINF